MIKMIAATAQNGIIGKNNSLPWSFDAYPQDMQFFRKMTANSAIIMGKNTWESISRLLPKRRNIVISRKEVDFKGLETFNSLNTAIESAAASHPDVFLIGGAGIYRDGMSYADEIYLSLIPEKVEGDNLVAFPWINPKTFQVSEYIDLDDKVQVAKYVRISK